MQSSNTFSKPIFYVIFILASLACLISIAVTVLTGVLGYIGFDGGTPIVVTTSLCQLYWQFKFASISGLLKTSFIHQVLSSLISIGLVVFLVILLVKLIKEEIVRFHGLTKIIIYILASLVVYTSIIPAGRFLTFRFELDDCTGSVYNSSHLMAIGFCGLALVIISLAVWILLMFVYWKSSDPSDKYREVTTTQTEAN